MVNRPDGDAVLQRLPLQALHDDEGPPLVLADVVDGADVGMIQGRGGLRLTLEALAGGRVVEVGLGKELQRDVAVKASVLGLVDDAHAPAAQLLDDAVVGDGLADHRLSRRLAAADMLPAMLHPRSALWTVSHPARGREHRRLRQGGTEPRGRSHSMIA